MQKECFVAVITKNYQTQFEGKTVGRRDGLFAMQFHENINEGVQLFNVRWGAHKPQNAQSFCSVMNLFFIQWADQYG